MRREKKIAAVGIISAFIAGCSIFSYAASDYTNVSTYMGMTVNEVMHEIPGMWWDDDGMGGGYEFITDGRVCFYYEPVVFPGSESVYDKKINRIVLNNHAGPEYRIGTSLCVGATYTDEEIYLRDMGYRNLLETADGRHIWKNDDGGVVIVTRGIWAGAVEIDFTSESTD